MAKKNIIMALVFFIVLIDGAIGFLLVRSRSFSHLAVWDIKESGREADFYLKPGDVSGYRSFNFIDSSESAIFRNEIQPFVVRENGDFNKILRAAKYIMDINSNQRPEPKPSLKWSSSIGMRNQIKAGSPANCFHRGILLSNYLSSVGIESRLWALENKRFDAIPHTVNEAYAADINKWVFLDTMFGFYVSESGTPLSFLELRSRLMASGRGRVIAHDIQNIGVKRELPPDYKKLVTCAFLRSGKGPAGGYNSRYGGLSALQRYIDKLPDKIRLGLDYLSGKRCAFIHYVDKSSASLMTDAIIAKSLFYFFVVTSFLSIVFVPLRRRAAARRRSGTRSGKF